MSADKTTLLRPGQKVLADRATAHQRLSDIKQVHTSIKAVYGDRFTVRGYSRYTFSGATMRSLGVDRLGVELIETGTDG